MRISEILASKQSFSFEIFPPRGELSRELAVQLASELCENSPDWISVTFSAGGTGNSANTVAIASSIENELATPALAHLTCMGSTKADVDLYIEALRELGVHNVLALRGDRGPGRETKDFAYACDLIAHLKSCAPDMCIGAACYPEGHVECADFERSMEHLYLKQEAGADFLVTQLFFNNEDFYRFREACNRWRVKIPIVCGIMPFTSTKQIQRMAFTCGASIPAKVIKRIAAAGDDADSQAQAGIEHAIEQVRDLANNGVDGIHIYTMNNPSIGSAIFRELLSEGYLAG